jgi:flagellar protein FlbD
MIRLTRLNGPGFALNSELIERLDSTPDTVITMVDGTKYLVTEPIDEIIERIQAFRAGVLIRAQTIEPSPSDDPPSGRTPLQLVQDDELGDDEPD